LCFAQTELASFYGSLLSPEDIPFQCGICSCAAEMKNTFVIDPCGALYKCLNDLGHNEWSLGSVCDSEQTLAPSPVAKYLGRDPFSEPECADCIYLPQCYGGCLWNYKKTGVHSCKAVKYLLADKIKMEHLSEEVKT